MSRLPSLPTLFGRATAVLGEHPTLHRTLERLADFRDRLADEPAPSPLEGCRIVDELIARIGAHFAAEEKEYFATLVGACPAFRQRITTLVGEHQDFLREADWLRSTLESGAGGGEDFRARVSRFIDDFGRHEAAETLLLHEFLIREEASVE